MSRNESQGQVVQIADRRTSTGDKPDSKPEVTPPTPPPEPPDVFTLLAQDRGDRRLHARAILTIHKGVIAAVQNLRVLAHRLEMRDTMLRDWLALPWWRRWFRRPPVLPAIDIRDEVKQ